MSFVRIALTALPFILYSNAAFAERWLYVSLLNEQKIVAFERNADTGRLTRKGATKCSAEPAFLAASRDGRVLFVSLRSTGQLASFRIDAASGTLTRLSVVEGGDDPAYLQTDVTGQFLFTAYYAANKVTVHRIASDGTLNKAPLQTVPTAQRAHGIGVTSDNRTVLVPHTGASRIYSFRFAQTTGVLSPMSPPYLSTPPDLEPRHIMLHPSDKWAFTSDEKGDSISMFALANGRLSLQQTLSTIPPGFDGAANSTARCEISPNGRFIYVANRGHDSLAAFSIDQGSGRLTSLGQTPTQKTPRSFTIDSTGRFLYAAGQASGKVATYRIGGDGRLKNLATDESGPVSWSVLAVDSR